MYLEIPSTMNYNIASSYPQKVKPCENDGLEFVIKIIHA